jgi:hypothetical protein
VQRLAILGADVDEVQSIVLAGHMGESVNGTFALSFDATACALWGDARRVEATTAPIAIFAGDAASVVAARIAAALNALPIFLGGGDAAAAAEEAVRVTGALTQEASDAGWLRYDFEVTFSGAGVGGDLPLLRLSDLDATMTPAPWLLLRGVDEVRPGAQLRGAVAVGYDDAQAAGAVAELALDAACGARAEDLAEGGGAAAAALAAWARAPAGARVAAVDLFAREDAIARALAELVFGCAPGALRAGWGAAAANASACRLAPPAPPAPAPILVRKVPTGGPGVAVDVHFLAGAPARGNVAQLEIVHPVLDAARAAAAGAAPLRVAPDAYAGDEAAPGGAAIFASSTLADGAQLGGALLLRLPRVDAASATGWTLDDDATVRVPWCASAAHLEAALRAADDARGLGLGVVTVSRARAGRPLAQGWAGDFEWELTFQRCGGGRGRGGRGPRREHR